MDGELVLRERICRRKVTDGVEGTTADQRPAYATQYATRQRRCIALLLRQSFDVHTGDGLNLWIGALMSYGVPRLLAGRTGHRVFCRQACPPSLSISADTGATGAGVGVTRMPVEASAPSSRRSRHLYSMLNNSRRVAYVMPEDFHPITVIS